MFCEFFTAFVTNIFFSFFLMKNVQNYFLLNRKVIGIKKDFFMLCLLLPPAHTESALFILYYPVEFGVTIISKEDISKLFSRRNLVLSPLYQKRQFSASSPQYGQIWIKKRTWFDKFL